MDVILSPESFWVRRWFYGHEVRTYEQLVSDIMAKFNVSHEEADQIYENYLWEDFYNENTP